MRERYFPGADVYLLRDNGEVHYIPVTVQEAAELAETYPEKNYFAIYRYVEEE